MSKHDFQWGEKLSECSLCCHVVIFRRVLNDRMNLNESLTDSQRLYTSENQYKAVIWQSESQLKWGSLIQPSHYSMSDAICAVSQTCLAVTAGWQICFRASSELESINMAAKRVPCVKPQRAQQQNCFHSKSVKSSHI